MILLLVWSCAVLGRLRGGLAEAKREPDLLTKAVSYGTFYSLTVA